MANTLEGHALRFEGDVAVVTGAGRGLGRAYAMALAGRGARVVVNDLEPACGEENGKASRAQSVVDEIRAMGGEAVANTDSVSTVEGGAAVVDTALSVFGQIDIVIHNAGISGRAPIEALPMDKLHAVMDVHLFGAFHVLRRAWPRFMEQFSGRVVLTTSGVGLFGSAGASSYGAAKMALVGLVRTLALEGLPFHIGVNAVAPLARTSMAGEVFGALTPKIDPELVAEAVVALSHRDTAVNGRIVSAGGGRVAEVFLGATQGYFKGALLAEDVVEHWGQVEDRSGYELPKDCMDEVAITARFIDP